MDASDTTIKRKAQAIYKDQYTKIVANNPSGDCTNINNCQTTNNCNKTFPSYENKNTFFKGRDACTNCNCN